MHTRYHLRASLIIHIFIFTSFAFDTIKAQDCIPGSAHAVLDVNNVRAHLFQSGAMFWKGSGPSGYIVPKDSSPSISSIFAGGVWIGGIQSNNIKTAATQFGISNNIVDWYPGPIEFYSGDTEKTICQNWDRHFEVRSDDIRQFLDIYQKQGGIVTIDQIPESLRAWPGKNNPLFRDQTGFDLPSSNLGLAPFWDANMDMIYNPMDGDYPIIRFEHCSEGVYADQMIFWIYNDTGNEHLQTKSAPMQVEVQQMAFAFDSSNFLSNTTYHHFKIINRSTERIDSAFFGLWLDPDLGCATDDYMGTAPNYQLSYVYNHDEYDGDDSCSCAQANFCTDIPIIGFDVLQAPINPPTTFAIRVPIDWEPDSLTIVFEEQTLAGDTLKLVRGLRQVPTAMSSVNYHVSSKNGLATLQGGPSSNPLNYYRYLTGSWSDGSRQVFGGSGYNPQSNNFDNYPFNSPPNDPNGWSMCTEDIPEIDLRLLQCSGPWSMDAGEIKTITQGIYFVPNITDYPCPDIAPLLKVDEISKRFFNDCFGFHSIISAVNESKANLHVNIYPNPAQSSIHIDTEEQIRSVRIVDASGALRVLIKDMSKPVDISFLPTGIYFALISGEKIQITKKLMVIR